MLYFEHLFTNCKGWTIETQKRKKKGKRDGKPDRFYVSPEGKKYRSREQMKRVDEQLNGYMNQ